LNPSLLIIGAVKTNGTDPKKYVSFKNRCFSLIAAKTIVAGIRNQRKFPRVLKLLSANKIGSVIIIDPCELKFFIKSLISQTKSIENINSNIIAVPKSSSPVIFFKSNPLFYQ
jgi:hypothetical protein